MRGTLTFTLSMYRVQEHFSRDKTFPIVEEQQCKFNLMIKTNAGQDHCGWCNRINVYRQKPANSSLDTEKTETVDEPEDK